jgi:hypothetical protein
VKQTGSVPLKTIGNIMSNRLEVSNQVQSGVYLGVCNEMHLAACFPVCCMQCDA